MNKPACATLFFYALGKVTYTLVAAVTILIGFSFPQSIPQDGSKPLPFSASSILVYGWVHWDSGWFLSIARYGYPYLYTPKRTPFSDVFNFFPMYPITIRAASYLTQESGLAVVAGLIVSNASLILSIYVLYKLLSMDYPASTVDRTLLFLVMFPTAFILTSVYYESLFILLTASAFYFSRLKKWLPAGIVGMMVALTVGFGVLIFIPLLVEFIRSEGVTLNALRELRTYGKGAPLLLIPAGLFAFMSYSYLTTGNWLEFVVATKDWYVEFSPPWRALAESAQIVLERGVGSSFQTSNLVNLAFALFATVVTIWAWFSRKIRTSYLLWLTLVLVVLLSAYRSQTGPYVWLGPIVGFPVWTIRLWPVFLQMGIGLSRHASVLVLTLSIGTLMFMCSLFVGGYYFGI